MSGSIYDETWTLNKGFSRFAQDAESAQTRECIFSRYFPDMTPAQPSCAVVLCTFNGSRFLREQLDSIASQSIHPTTILVSDDGSEDDSMRIVQAFSKSWTAGKTLNLHGPRSGYATNFLSTLAQVDPATQLIALSDQDDVWLRDKLAHAFEMLEPFGDTPALYGAATSICDENLSVIGTSRPLKVPLDFRHAIGQNFAGGNTMVLNNAALDLVQAAWPISGHVPVHDWWLYQLVSGAGGRVLYDSRPCLYYRQHVSNEIGDAAGVMAIANRLRRMAKGDYKRWNTANLKALNKCRSLLSDSSKRVLSEVLERRNGGVARRISMMRSPGLYRQGNLGQLGLVAALALNRF